MTTCTTADIRKPSVSPYRLAHSSCQLARRPRPARPGSATPPALLISLPARPPRSGGIEGAARAAARAPRVQGAPAPAHGSLDPRHLTGQRRRRQFGRGGALTRRPGEQPRKRILQRLQLLALPPDAHQREG